MSNRIRTANVDGINQTKFRVLFRSLGRTSDIVVTHNVEGDTMLLEMVKTGLRAGYHVIVRYTEEI